MSALLIMLASLVAALLLFASSLTFVARWLHYPRPGFRRALLVATIWIVLSILGFYVHMTTVDVPVSLAAVLSSLVLFLAALAAEVLAIRIVFKPTFAKALAGWGVLLVVRLAFVVAMLFGVRMPLVEAFRSPSLNMAPTLLCNHAIAVCPRCGGPLYFSMEEDLQRLRPLLGPPPTQFDGYCMSCRQSTPAEISSLTALPADRYFVTKFLSPRRWDIIAFHHKVDAQRDVRLVSRLVAVPGETISIDDQGKISLDNHSLLTPPDAPTQFRWADIFKDPNFPTALKPNATLRLGPDEYFVLGDFAERSNDSRTFGPIHKADIIGVVTLVYWPLSRARTLR